MVAPRLLFVFFVVTIGTSFQFGYHTGVINAPSDLIFNFTADILTQRNGNYEEAQVRTLLSVCVSAFIIGGMAGGLVGGLLANKLGRKKAIYVLSVPSILGCILMMVCKIANSFELIIVGRLLIGIACGAYTVVGPTYLSETAPLEVRGAAGVLHQLVTVTAIMISQLLGLPEVMGRESTWPYLLGLSVVLIVLSLILLLFCPESPRYTFLTKNDVDGASKALSLLRGQGCDIKAEIEDYGREQQACSAEKAKITDLFSISYLRLAVFVAMVAQMGQQLTAINGLMYYSVQLFRSVGLSPAAASYANLGIGATVLFWTILSVFLIDRLGRRSLLLWGFVITCFSLIAFTVVLIIREYTQIEWLSYLSIVTMYVFVSGFAIGPGSIPWFLVAEMFTQEKRDAVTSIAASTNWLSNVVVGFVFPQLIAYINIYAFLPFIGCLIIIIAILYVYLPETKGRLPAHIEDIFKRRCGAPITAGGDSTNPLYGDASEYSSDGAPAKEGVQRKWL